MTREPDILSRIKSLLESGRLSDMEKNRLNLLASAMRKNMQAYNEDPTVANKKNWDAAEAGLNELVVELWGKVFPEAEVTAFKNTAAVIKFLETEGYKVKKSKVYNDVTAGILRVETDGTFTRRNVERYISDPRSRIRKVEEKAKAGADVQTQDIHNRLKAAELKALENKIAKQEIELAILRKDYLPAAEFEMEVAARASVIDQSIRTWISLSAPDLAVMVGGKASMAGQLKTAMLEKLDVLLTGMVSTKTFLVMFEMGKEEG